MVENFSQLLDYYLYICYSFNRLINILLDTTNTTTFINIQYVLETNSISGDFK